LFFWIPVEGRWNIEAGFGACRKDIDDVDDYDDEEGVFLSLGPTLLLQFNGVLTLQRNTSSRTPSCCDCGIFRDV
jgi:hypothetical protein